jgi:hypothetical protein
MALWEGLEELHSLCPALMGAVEGVERILLSKMGKGVCVLRVITCAWEMNLGSWKGAVLYGRPIGTKAPTVRVAELRRVGEIS